MPKSGPTLSQKLKEMLLFLVITSQKDGSQVLEQDILFFSSVYFAHCIPCMRSHGICLSPTGLFHRYKEQTDSCQRGGRSGDYVKEGEGISQK